LARSLLDILISQGEFIKAGNPTTDFIGLEDNSIAPAVREVLSQNTFNYDNLNNRLQGLSDSNAESVYDGLRIAARNDDNLAELISRLTNLDEFLLDKITSTPLGSAYLSGIDYNRYTPEGMGGRQFPNNPGLADNEQVQAVIDGVARRTTLNNLGRNELSDNINNPPGGTSTRFSDSALSNSPQNAINNVLDFYSQGENNRLSTANGLPEEYGEVVRNLEDTTLIDAVNTPEEYSFLKQVLSKNRFQPIINGNELTIREFLGEREFTTNPVRLPPDNTDQLPFDQGVLTSNQANQNYKRSPASPDGSSPGGLVLLGEAKVEQINARQPNSANMGSIRDIGSTDTGILDSISQFESDEDINRVITNSVLYNIEKALPDISSDVSLARYFSLVRNQLGDENSIQRKSNYFRDLEQRLGEYSLPEFTNLADIGLVHLMYELSRTTKNLSGIGYGYSEGMVSRFDDERNTFLTDSISNPIIGGLAQAGNSLLRNVQTQLGRLSGTNRLIARALQAPYGSSLRESLSSPILSLVGSLQDQGSGAQSQNSDAAQSERIISRDLMMRELFSSNGGNNKVRPIKDRLQEGYEILGNPERSYREYDNMFIGLAEDVQTVKQFIVRNAADRFYLSLNQVQRSPINQYKGVGMELFGIPNSVFQRQEISNYSNRLGNIGQVDTQQLVNFVSQTASPITEAIRRSRGGAANSTGLIASQPKLILGKSQIPNLLGSSRSLEVMHSSLIGNRAGSIFQAYVRSDSSNENVDGLNMLTVLSQQLRFSSNMATGRLLGSTFINDLLLTSQESQNNNAANSNPDRNERQSGEPRRLGRAVAGARETIQNTGNLLSNAGDAFRDENVRNSLRRLAQNPQSFNVLDQLTLTNGRWMIAPKAVKVIEDSLEATYMPFYFQDLRTNEIISFHAFLKSAKTSFSPKWKKNNYIGRVDPVGTYEGSTERTVSVEFSVLAINPSDFGIMYDKINRFLGLLYPQYDEGIKLQDGANVNFMRNITGTSEDSLRLPVIPFSQRQIASPLIRMRIGDIIKSAAYDDNSTNTPKINPRAENYLGIRDLYVVRDADREAALQAEEEAATNQIEYLNQTIQSDLLIAGFTTINDVPIGNISFVDNNNVVTVGANFSDGGEITNVTMSGENFNNSTEELSNILNQRVTEINEIILRNQQTVNERVSAYNNSLSEYLATINSVEFANSVNRGNAVIRRAFEQIGGRGLAGFIDGSVDIELANSSNAYPWETEVGLRAPMGYDISFNFTVIHDVPPGLNYRGEMRPVFWPKKQIQYDTLEALIDPVTPTFAGISEVSNANPITAAQFTRPRSGGGPRSNIAYVVDYEVTEVASSSSPGGFSGNASFGNAPTDGRLDLGQSNNVLLRNVTIASPYRYGQRDPLDGARTVRIDGYAALLRITGTRSWQPELIQTNLNLDPTNPIEFDQNNSTASYAWAGVDQNVILINYYIAIPQDSNFTSVPVNPTNDLRGRRVRRV
jgi:hypothetical protein